MIETLFSPGAHTLLTTEKPDLALLYPAERDCVTGAVETRQRDFAMGRLCARRALAHFGVTDFPLLPGSDRAPIWPERLVGSLSHSGGLCAVAVAEKERFAGIGLDVELREPLERKLFRLVLTDREMAALSRHTDREAGRRAKIVFSAKESVFKCLWPLVRCFIDFRECEVALAEDGAFTAAVCGSAAHLAERLRGRFFVDGDHVFTGTSLAAGNPRGRRES